MRRKQYKGSILYAHVEPANKRFIVAASEELGLSISEFLNQMLTQLRGAAS